MQPRGFLKLSRNKWTLDVGFGFRSHVSSFMPMHTRTRICKWQQTLTQSLPHSCTYSGSYSDVGCAQACQLHTATIPQWLGLGTTQAGTVIVFPAVPWHNRVCSRRCRSARSRCLLQVEEQLLPAFGVTSGKTQALQQEAEESPSSHEESPGRDDRPNR